MSTTDTLRKLREEAALTQSEVAVLVEATEQSVANWEAGRATPGLTHTRRLAQIYGQTVAVIRGQEEPVLLPREKRLHLQQEHERLLQEKQHPQACEPQAAAAQPRG